MLVQQILASKASDAVVTIPATTTIARAATILAQERIGCLVVSSGGGRAEGVVSERDIVREVGRRGGPCLNDTVDKIMTRKVITCTRDQKAEVIIGMMTEGRFRHVPVMDEGRMVGLISIGDVVKARLAELSMERDALEGMIAGY